MRSPISPSEDRRSGPPWPLVAGLALPLVYVLSVGPMAMLCTARTPPPWLEKVLQHFYYPLVWAWEHSDACRSLLEWYLKLWGAP